VFAVLPFWIILASLAVMELFAACSGRRKILAWGALALLVVSALRQDALYFVFQNGDRPDWRGAFGVVERGLAAGDVIFSADTVTGEYYLGREVRSVYDVDPAALASGVERAWFVIAGDPWLTSEEDHRRSQPSAHDWIHRNSRLVEVLERHSPGRRLSLRVYLYDPGKD
jgi:hypothetical protein